MYERSTYSSELTYGEIVSGKKGRELERSAAARKGQETKQRRTAPTVDIVDIVMARLQELPDAVHIRGKLINVQEWKSPCLTIFFRELKTRGADRYAAYLESIQERLFEIIEIIKYDSDLDRIRAAFSELATLLKGSALNFDEMVDIEESYTRFDYR